MQSVTDLSVAGANSQVFELLFRRLPAGLVLDFFAAANDWEARHALADRFAGTAKMLGETVARCTELADRSDAIGRECAEFLLHSNAPMMALTAQLEGHSDPAFTIRWEGQDRLDRLVDAGRPIVAMVPHLAYFYAVPLVLALKKGRAAVLGNMVARDALNTVFPLFAPKLHERIEYIEVPSPTSARTAYSVLQQGAPLVVFPEVTQGATGNLGSVTGELLGRRVWVPTTIARFARMTGAAIVPIAVVPSGHREITVEVGEPVAPPQDRHADEAVSLKLFALLERMILARPQWWWGWPMLDTMMAVQAPVAAR
jgi:lauroyl/myristoyl acyltransferase